MGGGATYYHPAVRYFFCLFFDTNETEFHCKRKRKKSQPQVAWGMRVRPRISSKLDWSLRHAPFHTNLSSDHCVSSWIIVLTWIKVPTHLRLLKSHWVPALGTGKLSKLILRIKVGLQRRTCWLYLTLPRTVRTEAFSSGESVFMHFLRTFSCHSLALQIPLLSDKGKAMPYNNR